MKKGESKTDRKVRLAYIQSLARVVSCVPFNEPMTKEIFDKMWAENYMIMYSDKYKDKVHNTASILIENNVLRPIGIRLGYLNA